MYGATSANNDVSIWIAIASRQRLLNLGSLFIGRFPANITASPTLKPRNIMSGYAYIAAGKMKLKLGESPVHEIDSKFGNSLRQRVQDIQNRNAWKREGTGAQFMLRGAALWGTNAAEPESMRMTITGLCCGCAPDELFYTLETPEVGGGFSLRDSARQEQRLLHTNDYRLAQNHPFPWKDRCTCVILHKACN